MKRRYPIVSLCWKQAALIRRQERHIQRVLKAYRIVAADRDLLQRELDGWASTLEQIDHLPETEEPVNHPFDEEMELPRWPDADRLSMLDTLALALSDNWSGADNRDAEAVVDSLEDRGYRIVKS